MQLTYRYRVKVKNQRRDYLRKASAQLAQAHGLLAVGNVSSSQLAQTRMAKSVLDAGWSDFRSMLSYKAMRHGGRYTWKSRKHSPPAPVRRVGRNLAPQGVNGLRIRAWTCVACGEGHDRDVNAAMNMLRLGRQLLGEGAAA